MKQVLQKMIIAATVLAGCCVAHADDELITSYQLEAAFDDVRFDLENAIIDRGLTIDHTSHVGNMLARTKEDVGGTKDIFTHADVMLFCSANLSRKVMAADALNIAFCPYSVFVYETPDAPGKVTVGFRHVSERGSKASRAAIREVNALLHDIVQETAGE